MKTNPHDPRGLARPCSPGDLFTVAEGVQCGNCLSLVIDRRTQPVQPVVVKFRLDGKKAAIGDQKTSLENAIRRLDAAEANWRGTLYDEGEAREGTNRAVTVTRESQRKLVVQNDLGKTLTWTVEDV